MGRLLKAKLSGALAVGLQEMSDADIQTYVEPQLLQKLADNYTDLAYNNGTLLTIVPTGSAAPASAVLRSTVTHLTSNMSIGSHPGAANTSNTFYLYQTEYVQSLSGITPRPIEIVQNGSEVQLKPITDSSLFANTIASIVQTIINGGQNAYWLGTSAPVDGGTWVAVSSAGAMRDYYWNSGGATYTDYYLWRKTSAGSSGTAVVPYKALSNGSGVQEMSDAEVQALYPFIGEYIRQYGIGQYALSPSAPGTGTWVSRGSFTDTRNVITDTSYSGSYLGSFSGAFTGAYSQAFTGGFTGTYSRLFTGSYTSAYTGAYTGAFSSSYTGQYATTYTAAYTGAFTRVRNVTYTGLYNRGYTGLFAGSYQGKYVSSSVGSYTMTFSNLFVGNYTGAVFQVPYGGQPYAATYLGAYVGDFTAGTYTGLYQSDTYTSAYTGSSVVSYAGNYASPYTGTNYLGYYTGSYTGSYISRFVADVGAPGGNFTGSYTGGYGGTYTGLASKSYTANYTGAYSSVFSSSYTAQYTGLYTSTYAGAFSGAYSSAYAGNYTGAFSGVYTSNFTGMFTGIYTNVFSGMFTGAYSGLTTTATTETTTYTLWVRTA